MAALAGLADVMERNSENVLLLKSTCSKPGVRKETEYDNHHYRRSNYPPCRYCPDNHSVDTGYAKQEHDQYRRKQHPPSLHRLAVSNDQQDAP